MSRYISKRRRRQEILGKRVIYKFKKGTRVFVNLPGTGIHNTRVPIIGRYEKNKSRYYVIVVSDKKRSRAYTLNIIESKLRLNITDNPYD